MRGFKVGLGAVLCLTAIACGGGGGGTAGTGQPPPPPPTNNTASVIVDEGPSNASVNTMFTSVTVCVPGSTSSCQTIDHIQVDTGSYGLRILAPVLTLTLPVETLANGSSLAECTQFVDGFSWGPVVTADFQIAGETAKSLPVQVIGDSRFTNIPSECSGTGGTRRRHRSGIRRQWHSGRRALRAGLRRLRYEYPRPVFRVPDSRYDLHGHHGAGQYAGTESRYAFRGR